MFEITQLCASPKNAGRSYGEAVDWRVPGERVHTVDHLILQPCKPDFEADLAFSALPGSQARETEQAFAAAGIPVISNASAHRMDADVPLIIPEINPDHSGLIPVQQKKRGWKGFIVTNPNCSTIGLAIPLKALDDAFGVEKVNVVTLQAKSGAGYPGIDPAIIGGNLLPYIGNEEDKIETEPQKILGKLQDGALIHHGMKISAQCHRVDVLDGHTEALNLSFSKAVTPEAVVDVLRQFRGVPQELKLPFAPEQPIYVTDQPDRPQPKLDLMAGDGMSVTVGRVRSCPLFHIKMVILSHNTVRGAAGAAILNAELLREQGYL